MDRGAAYDDDIYTWSQEQAAVLRRLAETRRDLPNELDLGNIAEEIEDLGKSEIRTVESFAELLLQHLLKLASVPDARPAKHWRNEIDVQRRKLRKDLRRSMYQIIDLEGIWTAAKARADASLDQHDDALIAPLPEACPFSLDELSAAVFDLDGAIDRLRAFQAYATSTASSIG